MSTKLTLVNDAFDLGSSAIVLFQKNSLAPRTRRQVVWRAIRYCRFGWEHPFEFSDTVSVCIDDGFGNFSAAQPARPGARFDVCAIPSGKSLVARRGCLTDQKITVTNQLARGAVNSNLLRGGRIFAQQRDLAPLQTACFENDNDLWVGLTDDHLGFDFVCSVSVINSPTRLSLRNVASAEIVMRCARGGRRGKGKLASFELANINSG